MTSSNNTWQARLKDAMGPRGYHIGMRRSLQTIILYEARRAIEPRLKSLRPYQRKAAFMEQCFFLLDSLDFIFANQKVEVLWRVSRQWVVGRLLPCIARPNRVQPCGLVSSL